MKGAPQRAAGVGVFGGTFNPIHFGHLRAAEEVTELLALERMLFVPAASPPHKPGEADEGMAPARERLAWVRLAVEDNPRFECDPIEIERGGRSYSVDTLTALGARLAPQRPIFVIGCDAFAEIGTWREPEALLGLAHFAVITRPPVRRGSLAEWLPASLSSTVELAPDGRSGRHRGSGTWLRVVEIVSLELSSSQVRRCLRESRSVRYLLPEPVRRAVLASGIYGPRGDDARARREAMPRSREASRT